MGAHSRTQINQITSGLQGPGTPGPACFHHLAMELSLMPHSTQPSLEK